jgi:peptidoglycan/xylan/chitin deacetylase (PgdA/CDA1 family)
MPPLKHSYQKAWGQIGPLLGVRNLNMESMYEYGSRAGFWRLHRLFTRRGLPLTVYAVAMAMARNPDAVAAMNGGRLGNCQPRLSLD